MLSRFFYLHIITLLYILIYVCDNNQSVWLVISGFYIERETTSDSNSNDEKKNINGGK